MENFITEALLTELGFKLISLKESPHSKSGTLYGVAESINASGHTKIEWATDGHHCQYDGTLIAPNMSVGIKKDWDTRTAFNGYVFTEEDFRKIIELTW